MFSVSRRDTYSYRFNSHPVTIVVANGGVPLGDTDLHNLLPSATFYGMNAICNAIRLRSRRALLAPYHLLCNVIKDDVNVDVLIRTMAFIATKPGPGFNIARPSKHKQISFSVSHYEAPASLPTSRIDKVVDEIVRTCDDADAVIHKKPFKDWLNTEYKDHVTEAALIFGMCSEDVNHVELSSSISVLQPLGGLVGSYVKSNDANKSICDAAKSVNHDVSHTTNEVAMTNILPGDYIWACYTTDECPMLPLKLADTFPDNVIVVIDTNHLFAGKEKYYRLSSTSNIFVRNIDFNNNLAKRWRARSYTWTEFIRSDKIYFMGDRYAYELMLYNQRITNISSVCSYNDSYATDMAYVVPVTFKAIDVYHDIPHIDFSKHFYIPYGVMYNDTVHHLTKNSIQYVCYGATLLYDKEWYVENLPRNNIVFQKIRLVIRTSKCKISVLIMPVVPCRATISLVTNQRTFPGAWKYFIAGIRLTTSQLEIADFDSHY